MADALSADPVAALERIAGASPNSPAISWSGGSWSYGSLWQRVVERGERMRSERVSGGCIVSVAHREGPAYLADLLAVWWAGAAVAPFHPRGTEAERQHADALFRPLFHIDEQGELSWRRSLEEALVTPLESQAAAGIRTSGSSGEPRGVVLGHGGFRASAAGSLERLDLSASDRWGLVLSTAHVGGLATVTRAILLGASLRIFSAFDASSVATSILEGEISHVSLVPSMLDDLLDEGLTDPPDSLRCALLGGARTPPGLLGKALDARIPVALTWGMTETTSQIATAPPDVVRRVGGTVGLPLTGLEVNAVGGRLGVRGPTLALGIVPGPGQDPKPLALEEGGWLRTQDRGRLDGDGRVWVEGRADRVIVSGGINVDPSEVEAVMSEVAGVREVAVFGMPDDKWGQVVVGAVVSAAGQGPTSEDLIAYCRGRLTRSKCPSQIVMVPKLPRTPSGKVATRRLPDLISHDGR